MSNLIYLQFILISLFSISLSKDKDSGTEEGNILFPITDPISIEYNPHKTNQYNKNYFILQLKIGDPSQTFNVQIDTRSSISWLPSKDCSNCFHSTKKYDYYKSYSSKTTDEHIKLKDEDGNNYFKKYKIEEVKVLKDTKKSISQDFASKEEMQELKKLEAMDKAEKKNSSGDEI